MKMFNKKMSNRGFTIIEMIVVIAVIGILVLLGIPRFIGYTQKAELARIQHDVKVMENEMSSVLAADNNFNEWQNNGKDLGRVVMRKELYEKQGVTKNLDWEHLSAKWTRADVSQLANENNELGVGGNLIELDDKYSTYKIIPKEYSNKINTKLKGTFYVNPLGKVYYEHDKSLGKAIEKESLACVAPSTLGYEFEIISDLGTITGWNGNATHLVIPAAFKMNEGGKEWCEPVRVIGARAFQNGTFKRVTIPQSIEEIKDDSFQGGELIEIEIPHSVKTVGDNAFMDNPATSSGGDGGSVGSGSSGGSSSSVTVKGSSSGRNISDSAFGGLSPNYSPVTDKDLSVITKVKNNSGKTVSIVGKIVTSDNSSDYSNTVINVPKELEINGEILQVTEIEKGAFQGSGLIDVIMPEGLLYIHDYAFAGNQLIRAVIPNSVIEIGNYAFAYNEIESEPTIDPIDILESKFTGNFGYVNNEGNISQPVSTIDLKAHIFIISSMGNHIVEDVGTNLGEPEKDRSDDSEEQSGLINPVKSREPEDGETPISSAEELAKVGIDETYPLNGKYILMSDIDLSEIENWTPIGDNPNRFKGQFDGNGYKISNLTITTTQNYVGLFGYVEKATIKNVTLLNVDVTGKESVGGLVGRVGSGTKISNSYATGSVTGSSGVGGLVGRAYFSNIRNSYATGSAIGSGDEVGGLVGRADYGSIEESHATGSAKGSSGVGGLVGNTYGHVPIRDSYSTVAVTGTKTVGGLVGTAINSVTISNSYATGAVTGGNQVGGLVGQASAISSLSVTISNSYATGKVTGTGGYVGGLVGSASSTSISNSYWDRTTTGQSKSSGGGVDKSTDDMKKQTTYKDWDFVKIWEIDEGNDYPKLR